MCTQYIYAHKNTLTNAREMNLYLWVLARALEWLKQEDDRV